MNQDIHKKVAFVHDFLLSYGGAERVLQSLVKLDTQAPIYTLLADEEMVKKHFPDREIRTSFLQKLPRFFRKRYRFLLPFFAVAAESFDFRDFDTVLSSSGAWSKGIVTRLRTTHIAYLHSPMRYLWDTNERYLGLIRAGICRRFFGRIVLSYLRLWDREAAERPDILLANSEFTAARIRKYYRRESEVILPPVTLNQNPSAPSASLRAALRAGSKTRQLPLERGAGEEDFFLVVARLSESKEVGAVIDAFSKLDLPLRIVGEGPMEQRLRKQASRSVVFMGRVGDGELAQLYKEAQAVVVPSEEDFGLAAAEALSFGTPVITLAEGGAREVVEEGVTGECFRAATPEVIAAAVRRFLERGSDAYRVDREAVSEKFSETRFLEAFRGIISESIRT